MIMNLRPYLSLHTSVLHEQHINCMYPIHLLLLGIQNIWYICHGLCHTLGINSLKLRKCLCFDIKMFSLTMLIRLLCIHANFSQVFSFGSLWWWIKHSGKSHNSPVPYPTMHHSEQKCAHFCSEWCIVGYGTGALWDFWEWSIISTQTSDNIDQQHHRVYH